MRDGYDVSFIGDAARIRVWGASHRELFERALLGIAALLRPDFISAPRPDVSRHIHLRGNNVQELFQRFLSRIVFESEMHAAVFLTMHVISFMPEELVCELSGKKADHLEEEITEAHLTHECIHREGSGWEAEFMVW